MHYILKHTQLDEEETIGRIWISFMYADARYMDAV